MWTGTVQILYLQLFTAVEVKSTFSITSELTNQNGSAKRPIHLILVAFCYWNCQTMKGSLQFGQKASEQKQGFANWKHTGCRSLYAALKP